MDREPSGLDWFFQEVARRRLIHAAGVYVVVCWFLVQLLATLSPHFGFPDWIVRLAMALTFAGLPAVLGSAWLFGGGGAAEAAERRPRERAPTPHLPETAAGRGAASENDRTPWMPTPETVLLVVLAFVGGSLWAYRTFRPDPASPGSPSSLLAPEVTRRAIAVLPFENVGGDPREEYFSQGVSEEIRSALSRVPELSVASRTSTFRFADGSTTVRQIAGELQVGSILEGSVRRAGERLRVTVRLVDTRTDEQLWSATYDRTLDVENLFAVEAEIARSVAAALEVELGRGAERRLLGNTPVSLEAHELYLLGLYHWTRRTGEELTRAVELFEAAAEQDPAYALAHAGLANSHVLLPLYAGVPADSSMPEARGAAARALALDSTLAEAHAALAFVRTTYDWDWEGAEASFRTALSRDPSYATAHEWYGLLLDATGRHEEARQRLERALELDPLSLIINEVLGNHHMFVGDLDAATSQLLRTLELDPDFPLALQFLAQTHLLAERPDEAAAALERWARATGTPEEPWGVVARATSDPTLGEEARRALARFEAEGVLSPYRLAQYHALIGAREQALDALERAYEEKDFLLFLVAVDPALESLHEDPRYRRILEDMGLPSDP